MRRMVHYDGEFERRRGRCNSLSTAFGSWPDRPAQDAARTVTPPPTPDTAGGSLGAQKIVPSVTEAQIFGALRFS
jgi:hypothetical protein